MNAVQVPFCAAHVRRIDVQPAQQWMARHLAGVDLAPLETDLATTLLLDGEPVACSGVLPKWEGVGFLWCLLGKQLAGKNFLPFNRVASRFLEGLPFSRIETAVEPEFEAGKRWVLMHGFRDETQGIPARKYMLGMDLLVYAKVR